MSRPVKDTREDWQECTFAGVDFIRVGAVGVRIRETPLRFPNSWAGGKIYPCEASATNNHSNLPRRARARQVRAGGKTGFFGYGCSTRVTAI